MMVYKHLSIEYSMMRYRYKATYEFDIFAFSQKKGTAPLRRAVSAPGDRFMMIFTAHFPTYGRPTSYELQQIRSKCIFFGWDYDGETGFTE